MYGKTIFGTDEAFEGYDKLEKTNWICNTANDFIQKINEYFAKEQSKINEYSRCVFINNYCTSILEKSLYILILECIHESNFN
jgi:hypothetical protein